MIVAKHTQITTRSFSKTGTNAASSRLLLGTPSRHKAQNEPHRASCLHFRTALGTWWLLTPTLPSGARATGSRQDPNQKQRESLTQNKKQLIGRASHFDVQASTRTTRIFSRPTRANNMHRTASQIGLPAQKIQDSGDTMPSRMHKNLIIVNPQTYTKGTDLTSEFSPILKICWSGQNPKSTPINFEFTQY